MVNGLKRSDPVIKSISRGSADDMVLNPTLDVFSAITCGGWNLQGDNRILLYLNIFKIFFYAERALQGAQDETAMIYPPTYHTL